MNHATGEQSNRIDAVRERIREMYEAKLHELKRNALYLGEKMARTAANCDRALEQLDEPTYTHINGLGEVQSLGSEIDRNCGELDHLYQVLQMLRYANRPKTQAETQATSTAGKH